MYTNISLFPGPIGLSFLSPITMCRIETPVNRGVPESVIATGILYSFRCSRSKDTIVESILPVNKTTIRPPHLNETLNNKTLNEPKQKVKRFIKFANINSCNESTKRKLNVEFEIFTKSIRSEAI